MKNDEQFDDLLRQKANNHEAPVPADAWDNIMRKKKKRRFIIFWWCLAGVLLAGNAGYLVYKDFSKSNAPDNAVQQAALDNNDKEQVIARAKIEKETNELSVEKTVIKDRVEEVGDGIHLKADSAEKRSDKKETNDKFIPQEKTDNLKASDKKINKATEDNALVNEESIAGNKCGRQKANGTIASKKQTVFLGNKKSGSQLDNAVAENDFSVDKKDRYLDKQNEAGSPDKTISQTQEKPNDKSEVFANDRQTLTDEQNAKATKTTDEIVSSSNSTTKTGSIIISDTSSTIAGGDSSSNDAPVADKKFIQIKQPKNKTWWIDMSATPFASISNSKKISQLNRTTQMPGYIAEYTAGQVKISQQPGVAFAIGVRKSLNKKWALGAGFAYQQIKEKISLSGTETHVATTVVQRLDQTASGPVLVNDTISSTTTGVRSVNALNSYTLMGVPVFAQYRLAQRKSLLFDISAGSFINLSRKYSNSVAGSFVGQNSIDIKPGGDLKVGFDLFAEIRVSKSLTKNIFVFAAPGFRYNLSEYKLKGMLKHTFLHQAGLGVGLSIKL